MKQVSQQVIAEVVYLLHNGHSYTQIAAQLQLSKTSICRIKQRYLPDLAHSKGGRPKLLDERKVRMMVRQITSGQLDTAVDVAKRVKQVEDTEISADTVRRALKKAGMKAAVKQKKPFLRPQHIRARLAFAQRHKYWTVDDWKRVIWSDETKINRFGPDGRKWFWKKPGEELKPRHFKATVKHGGGSVMVWGSMTAHGPGSLRHIEGRLDSELYCRIIEDELPRTIEKYRMDQGDVIFQHDNDPKHTARRTVKWLQDHQLKVLQWPAQSPDLNPIEHLWDLVKRKLAKHEDIPRGVNEFWQRIEREWETITTAECLKLVESMPNRVAAVLKAKGGHTKY